MQDRKNSTVEHLNTPSTTPNARSIGNAALAGAVSVMERFGSTTDMPFDSELAEALSTVDTNPSMQTVEYLSVWGVDGKRTHEIIYLDDEPQPADDDS